MRLTWTDRSATETGFRIERSPLTNTNFTEIATVGANTTSFTDSGLSRATTYYYRVRAYNADTTSDYSSENKLRPFTTFQQRHPDLQLRLSYQTRSVSPGSDKDGEIYSVRYDAVNAISTNR